MDSGPLSNSIGAFSKAAFNVKFNGVVDWFRICLACETDEGFHVDIFPKRC